MQVNIGKERGQHPSLRRAAEGGVPRPVLQVPGLQHLPDEPEEPVIADFLAPVPRASTSWSSESKQSEMSPSMNQVVPVQVFATSL